MSEGLLGKASEVYKPTPQCACGGKGIVTRIKDNNGVRIQSCGGHLLDLTGLEDGMYFIENAQCMFCPDKTEKNCDVCQKPRCEKDHYYSRCGDCHGSCSPEETARVFGKMTRASIEFIKAVREKKSLAWVFPEGEVLSPIALEKALQKREAETMAEAIRLVEEYFKSRCVVNNDGHCKYWNEQNEDNGHKLVYDKFFPQEVLDGATSALKSSLDK